MTPLPVGADVCPAMGPTEAPTTGVVPPSGMVPPNGVVPPSAPTGTVPASDEGTALVPVAWPMTPGARLVSMPVPAPIAVLYEVVCEVVCGCARRHIALSSQFTSSHKLALA